MHTDVIHHVDAEGFLAIGDPHVSSRKPGTRNDRSFVDTVIGKIEQCAVIANERNLQALFLGDLFDRDRETDPYLLVKLIRAINLFDRKPFELMGNHDINETCLTDNTSLALMREAGVLTVVDQTGLFLVVTLPDGKKIGVGGSPYGTEIPNDVTGIRGTAAVDQLCWLTHHDLAFEGAYPGAAAMFEIAGCDLVVNGHMHLTKAPVKKGQTTWFNPGNITRQSKDTATHVPSVWAVTDTLQPATQIPLVYQEKIFDVIEGFVAAVRPDAPIAPASVFVEMLKSYTEQDIAKTEDGSVLAQDLATICEEMKVAGDVAGILQSLHAAVVE